LEKTVPEDNAAANAIFEHVVKYMDKLETSEISKLLNVIDFLPCADNALKALNENMKKHIINAKSNPNADNYEQVVWSLRNIELEESALEAANHAEALGIKDGEIYQQKAFALSFLNRPEELISFVDKAIEENIIDEYGDILFASAYAHKQLKRYDRASELFKRGLEIKPDNYDGPLGLGEIYEETNQPAIAKQYYEQFLLIHDKEGDPELHDEISERVLRLGAAAAAASLSFPGKN
jgi:tetratricopeptide (TPR) repeat protein